MNRDKRSQTFQLGLDWADWYWWGAVNTMRVG